MAIRIGTEDKKKLVMASVLGVFALGGAIYTAINLFGGPPAPAPMPMVMEHHPASPARRNAGSERRATSQGGQAGQSGMNSMGMQHSAARLESASDLDPSLHPEIMHFAETIEYTGDGRNIFSKDSVPPAVAAAAALRMEKLVAPVRTGPVIPAGPPPPPPIDLKFYGFATTQNGRKTVFLLHGEDIFVAGEGDIVDRSYRVIQILPTSVVVEDLSYNDKQTLPLQEN